MSLITGRRRPNAGGAAGPPAVRRRPRAWHDPGVPVRALLDRGGAQHRGRGGHPERGPGRDAAYDAGGERPQRHRRRAEPGSGHRAARPATRSRSTRPRSRSSTDARDPPAPVLPGGGGRRSSGSSSPPSRVRRRVRRRTASSTPRSGTSTPRSRRVRGPWAPRRSSPRPAAGGAGCQLPPRHYYGGGRHADRGHRSRLRPGRPRRDRARGRGRARRDPRADGRGLRDPGGRRGSARRGRRRRAPVRLEGVLPLCPVPGDP